MREQQSSRTREKKLFIGIFLRLGSEFIESSFFLRILHQLIIDRILKGLPAGLDNIERNPTVPHWLSAS
ncbi:hypothetical protein VU01_14692, partial [Candidatus Electrothrix marina]